MKSKANFCTSKSLRLVLAIVLFSVFSVSFVHADPKKGAPGKGKGKGHASEHKHHKKHGGKKHEEDDYWWKDIGGHVSHGRFSVPPGHRPPPGKCRLWYPDRPPGHQPPSVDCGSISMGSGAYIIYGEHGYDPGYDWRRADSDIRRTIPHIVLDIILDQLDRG